MLILQAQDTGQAVLSGSVQVTNWSNVGGGFYTLPWTNKWGLSASTMGGGLHSLQPAAGDGVY